MQSEAKHCRQHIAAVNLTRHEEARRRRRRRRRRRARRRAALRAAAQQLALHLGRARNSLDGKHDIVD
jgi:hypothetical protein